MAYAGRAPSAYQEVQVRGTDARGLVTLLFQGLMKFLVRARAALEEQDYARKADALGKAQGILSELICSLDEEKAPELSRSLKALYAHLQRELVEADLTDDLERLDYVIEIVQRLYDAWEEALRRCQQQGGQEPGATAG
jgi:flagellar protein FliS